METVAPTTSDAQSPRTRWRVWSWRILAAVVAAPFLVAVGLVVWMFVPRSSTETLPHALYAGEVDGIPIVVEWPPSSPYHQDWPIPEGWTVKDLPDSVLGTGPFFAQDAASWRVEIQDQGCRLRITNGAGCKVELRRMATIQRQITQRGARVADYGRTLTHELTSPAWIDAREWPVELVAAQGTGWSKLETRSVWDDGDDFYWSWTDPIRDYSLEWRDMSVMAATKQVFTLQVVEGFSRYGCGREPERVCLTWYRGSENAAPVSVTLDRFFRPGSGWQDRLDHLLTEAFKIEVARLSEEDVTEEDVLRGVHHRGIPCFVTPGGFHFHNPWHEDFDPPVAAKLFVPWSQLDDVLATDGPAAALRARPADES
jgi:hypothetical protein